ncbi:extracellular solute-binding protein [Paenibacillus psychroresistens]|uniref:Extracellular solute-binding protein n=1 Tax=Paenibacillus psychroresistens TaxID=1778678 RepID=A0A6B8RHC1_9BACL|nr:extracellular solute-binding protein [Paenibacillus psychroresistens]QGQ94796.1 extracellular solute-binding protein [Paenibacillus psychroresistens]
MNIKLLFQASSLLLILSLFAGCNKAAIAPSVTEDSKAQVKGKITFLNHRTDIDETKMKGYLAAFKKLYPLAEVENQAVPDQSSIVKVRAASGQLPDVVLVGGDVMRLKDYPKFFIPLDDLGFEGKIHFEDQNRIAGKLYGISSGGSITGVLYNKKAFLSAGIREVPTTLDAFYAACEKLKLQGIVPVAINFKDIWPLAQYEKLAQSIAGDAFILNKLSMIDTPFTQNSAYGKALEILRTLATKKYIEKDLFSTNWEASKKNLASGEFAMAVLGNWAIPQIIENGAKAEDIGFFPMPVDNSGKLVSLIGSDAVLAISNTSKNIATAKAFVKFFVEQSGYDSDSGFIPTLISTTPKLQQLADFMSGKPKLMEGGPTNEFTNKLMNKAQFSFPNLAQEYVVIAEKDKQSVFDKYNKKWAGARKALGQ